MATSKSLDRRLVALEGAQGEPGQGASIVIYDPVTGEDLKWLSPSRPQAIQEGGVIIYLPHNGRERL